MAQKPVLRGEVGCACVRVRSVSRGGVWASAGVQGAWVASNVVLPIEQEVGDAGPHHHKHIERALKHIERDEYQRYTYQSDLSMCLVLYLPFLSSCC